MKRHLPGLLIFGLIVGVSIAALAFVRSVSDSFDTASVPPVVDDVEHPRFSSLTEEDYVVRLVQYNYLTRRLTAPLEIERRSLAGRSNVKIGFTINSSDSDSETFRLDTVADVLPGKGEKAFVVVDTIVPGNIVFRKDQNYYISFRIDSNVGDSTDRTGFGKPSPVVFVHPQPTKRPGGPGPVILQ